VNANPQNPIIGVRSFGSDPRAVAEHAAAWIAGMQGAGVAACAKHFPGHGDTSVDSHVVLPVAQEDPHLRALAPFEAAIDCAIAAAVEEGRLTSERLAEAASRLARLTRPIGATRHFPTSGEVAAQQAARRAIRADGPVRIGDRAAVIRFGSPSSIAAGDIPWGIAAALVARGVRVTEAETEIAGQAVVIAVRDLHRD